MVATKPGYRKIRLVTSCADYDLLQSPEIFTQNLKLLLCRERTWLLVSSRWTMILYMYRRSSGLASTAPVCRHCSIPASFHLLLTDAALGPARPLRSRQL